MNFMVSLCPEKELGDTMFNLVDGTPPQPTVNTYLPAAFVVKPGDKIIKGTSRHLGISSLVNMKNTERDNQEARSQGNLKVAGMGKRGAMPVAPTMSGGRDAGNMGSKLSDNMSMKGLPDGQQRLSLRVVNFPSGMAGGSEGGLSGEKAEKLSLAMKWSNYNSSGSISVCY